MHAGRGVVTTDGPLFMTRLGSGGHRCHTGEAPGAGHTPLAAAAAAASPALPQAAAGGAEARIYDLVNRHMGALKHLHLLNPRVLLPLMATNMETGQPLAAPAPDSFWRRVASRLALTQRQRDGAAAMRGLHARYMGAVLRDRARLQAQLAAAMHPLDRADSVGRGAAAAAAAAMAADRSTTLAMEAAEALAANMKREEAVRTLLHQFLLQHQLTPVQMARLATHAHPLLPDAFALMLVMCEPPPGNAAAGDGGSGSGV
ncbi:MAG: hypothetical protein J3K34DRAFT_293281 [Monoraphidium minutum]|nr:MAG: hypothetical protein J3K34DRAFT_293281 [Monoraphidium minutum]